MATVYYMWNFKPDERSDLNQKVIIHNARFIKYYKIITPNELKYLLDKNDVFPNLSELYDMIPHWVSKADLGRLLLIYFYGGIYSDVDCFIQKPFTSHAKNNNVVLFTENVCSSTDQLGPRECKNPENAVRISNYFFGCRTPLHPFFKEVIEECLSRLTQLLLVEKNTNINSDDILWMCGPDVITSVYHKSKHNYHDILLYDTSFLSHRCYGSWR